MHPGTCAPNSGDNPTLSANVRFSTRFVRFTPRSGPLWRCPRSSAFDPKLTLALPKAVEYWSLNTPREKLIKIGAKVVRYGRYVTFQLAEVALPRSLFRKILCLIDDLRPRLAPA